MECQINSDYTNIAQMSATSNSLEDDFVFNIDYISSRFSSGNDYLHYDVIDKFKECLDEFNTINFINRKIKFLSSGEKQRIVLTRLVFFLKLNHQIWILDEPINNLDSQNNNSFCNILKKHRSNGGITIMSTHVPLVQNFRAKEILLD